MATQDQPHVLGYLHQISKNLDVYLKVGAVKHKLNNYIDSDPPVGIQLHDDADEVSLDVLLENFDAVQAFVEKILAGICESCGVSVDALVSKRARVRLILASGGVARDYLKFVHFALRRANERSPGPATPNNRITQQDVNEVAQQLSADKQSDLNRDAVAEAEALLARFSDLLTFCLEDNSTDAFIVEADSLREQLWGREIEGLADFRLIHRLGNVTIQSSNYRRRQFVAFVLDLSSYTGRRAGSSVNQIEFWKPEGWQKLRRVTLVYEPLEKRAASRKRSSEEIQLDLFNEAKS